MAKPILPHRSDTRAISGGSAPTPTRDYAAEYARREAKALALGYPSYWAYRKAQSWADQRAS